MRTCSTLCSALVLSLAACGSDPPPPEEEIDFGFLQPELSLRANVEVSDSKFEDAGPADMACLNTPNSDPATTVEVTLTTEVRDFQSDNLVPNAVIEVFDDQDVDNPFLTITADENAVATITPIPIGTKRFGYRMTDPESLDTLLLNQKVEPDVAEQTEGSIRTVSKQTAATMPALIGIARTAGTGVLAGAMRDCQDREVSNFIAAVVTSRGATSGTYEEILAQIEATKVEGADTYYFRTLAGKSLPVRHSQESAGTGDGLFMVVELAPAPTALVQVWGYVDDAALAADQLTLIAELQTESIGDTVITGSYEPIRE